MVQIKIEPKFQLIQKKKLKTLKENTIYFVGTRTWPDGLSMLWNCFLDFAVKHCFGCRTTEPGFTGDIGAIEVWLIDWLNVAPNPEKDTVNYINNINCNARQKVKKFYVTLVLMIYLKIWKST